MSIGIIELIVVVVLQENRRVGKKKKWVEFTD